MKNEIKEEKKGITSVSWTRENGKVDMCYGVIRLSRNNGTFEKK